MKNYNFTWLMNAFSFIAITLFCVTMISCSDDESMESVDDYDQDFTNLTKEGFEDWIHGVFLQDEDFREFHEQISLSSNAPVDRVEVSLHNIDGKYFISQRYYRIIRNYMMWITMPSSVDGMKPAIYLTQESCCTPGGQIIKNQKLKKRILEDNGTLLFSENVYFMAPSLFYQLFEDDWYKPYFANSLKKLFADKMAEYNNKIFRFTIGEFLYPENFSGTKEFLISFLWQVPATDEQKRLYNNYPLEKNEDVLMTYLKYYVIETSGEIVEKSYDEVDEMLKGIDHDDRRFESRCYTVMGNVRYERPYLSMF